MKALISTIALTFALSIGVAQAADAEKKASPAQTAQQEKMKACNKEAADKKLAGDPRKAFMKDCLSADGAAADAKPAANAACEAKAAEKKLAGAAKGSFIKKCEQDAKGGDSATTACEGQATDKKLAGAAKTSFLKKCVADAQAAKK